MADNIERETAHKRKLLKMEQKQLVPENLVESVSEAKRPVRVRVVQSSTNTYPFPTAEDSISRNAKNECVEDINLLVRTPPDPDDLFDLFDKGEDGQSYSDFDLMEI